MASLEKRPFCLNLIKELHAILLDSVRGRNKAPGQFRRIQNYIAPPGSPIERTTFMPPSTEQLPQALDNWERHLHFDEKDGLVQLAVIKAQFEIIHPFLDGNGRLGPSPLYKPSSVQYRTEDGSHVGALPPFHHVQNRR